PATFDLVVDGVLLTSVAQGESGGPASPTLTEVYTESPGPEPAMNLNLYQVLVRPKDDLGLRLGPYANVQLVVHPDFGTETVTVKSDLGPNAQMDGDHYFVLERPAGSAVGSATGTYDVFVDGVLITTVAYDF
ncbi:MAG: hypothetical protein O7B99_00470, partial [Planctomycetota bacterium]|nr:hypothetical protein [Planctomycetota bacterium]